MLRAAFAAFVLSCALASPADAHETFLLPAHFAADPGEPRAISLASAETFPALDYGPHADRFASLEAAGGALSLGAWGPDAMRLSFAPSRQGLAVAAIALAPHDIDLDPEHVAAYFEELQAGPELVTAYEALPQPRVWRETYTKYAKTFFCVGPCGDGLAATRRFGHALEFVAIADHGRADLRRFRLLTHGRPAANIVTAIWREDGSHIFTHTDGDGVLALPADTHGVVMLATIIVRPPSSPDARFTSDFATLTFAAP